MSIEGRITVDCLFHDKDGAASLKVVSLQGSTEYTTGKVAIVTGTCGTTHVQIDPNPSTYRNAAGSIVSIAQVRRVAFSATSPYPGALLQDSSGTVLRSVGGSVAVSDSIDAGGGEFLVHVGGTAGTASYTLVIYGV